MLVWLETCAGTSGNPQVALGKMLVRYEACVFLARLAASLKTEIGTLAETTGTRKSFSREPDFYERVSNGQPS